MRRFWCSDDSTSKRVLESGCSGVFLSETVEDYSTVNCSSRVSNTRYRYEQKHSHNRQKVVSGSKAFMKRLRELHVKFNQSFNSWKVQHTRAYIYSTYPIEATRRHTYMKSCSNSCTQI